ncbi:spore cortex-lytic enzyme [Metabacillus sp. CT-WN-B3]|uniref:Spore cortex-lytic enzyme n=2 Tax=Metabacillus hrfriensis TaxID=3048891 RepID=A0ACD4RIE5_9BACI|nr:spore cortex-lytic enzyme [Metabacillus sp. CT-WN-B3]WHZ60298.1 spore cortex-lytic enzyme [Metabacillus sp. CT-WN-B3]
MTFLNQNKAHAFSNQVIQKGAVGDDVVELQARLQYNGYYNGSIDGVYGWSTYWAVRNFQYEFGLKEIDGLVGESTKNKLTQSTKYYRDFVHKQLNSGKDFTHYGGVPLSKQSAPSKEFKAKMRASYGKKGAGKAQAGQAKQTQPKQQPKQQAQQPKQQAQQPKQQAQPKAESQAKAKTTAVNMPEGFSQNDIQLMANAVYGEARGEPYIGQVAVAAVILNRVDSPTFPNTVSGVIFEPRAFTAVADGQIWLTPNETAKKAVMDAINGWDPTENATYYFNPNTATSGWIWGRPQIKQIGKHIFCN